jgi:hypothetical protein
MGEIEGFRMTEVPTETWPNPAPLFLLEQYQRGAPERQDETHDIAAEKSSNPWSLRFQNLPSVVEKCPWYDLENRRVVRLRKDKTRAGLCSIVTSIRGETDKD